MWTYAPFSSKLIFSELNVGHGENLSCKFSVHWKVKKDA